MFFLVKPTAWMDDIKLVTVSIDPFTPKFKNSFPKIFQKKNKVFFQITKIKNLNENVYQIYLSESLPIGEEVVLQWEDTEIPIYPGKIVRTDWFDQHFSVSNVQFGAICSDDKTIFRLWAPTATSVILRLNDQLYELIREEKGVWTKILTGDWHGAIYEYIVTVNGNTHVVIDPYAKGSLANTSKGVVINFSKTVKPDAERPKLASLQDAVIYELHVRDATKDSESGVINSGKFLGLQEIGTKTEKGFSTGLDYIKELGVTHVELLPINDFARVDELKPDRQYNWGYDPLLYQVPEGSYSTNPNDPLSRINECKKMIEAFHRANIGVILDVVFNHAFIEENIEETIFEKIVPGYYFRYDEQGNLANGTGCGNEFATERKMVRKFFVDTIDFWLKEYQVDGFRFDLMGIMDTETMKQIYQRCQLEEVPIMLLGEGWNLPSPLPESEKAIMANASSLGGIRFFNDRFRDILKGNLFSLEDRGFINGQGRFFEKLPDIVSGSCLEKYGSPFVPDVTQTINYVECHDNHTLWDRLSITNSEEPESVRKKMHQLATGITLVSQGVPFIHAGQEWFRTKNGIENSFRSGDEINQLDWKKREQEVDTIEFVKNLIRLRKSCDVFRMESKKEVEQRLHILTTNRPIFGFTLLGDREEFAIYINPTKACGKIWLPSSGQWKVLVTNDFENRVNEHLIIGEYTNINPLEFLVLMKN